MKLELSIAADGALVVRPPHPMSSALPASSSLVTPSTPMRETGSCAPTSAQATPSSSRCCARSRTDVGTSSSVVLASQVASRPVGPFGSVAARARLPATALARTAILFLLSCRGGLVVELRALRRHWTQPEEHMVNERL